ncbi:glycosyltransferase [Salinicoccus siamensis]|uniref:glycosyltransferase n=1 Tax=Salinicoccus siamensis TaxID=381830 RepID=UPI00360ABFAC
MGRIVQGICFWRCIHLPISSETLGLVILESMASGLPVIAAKSGPTNEQVEHGVNGMLFENENIESMLEAVSVLEDPEHLDLLRRNARKEALDFAWDKTSQRLIDFYMEARNDTLLEVKLYSVEGRYV